MTYYLNKTNAYNAIIDESRFKYISLVSPSTFPIRYQANSNEKIQTIVYNNILEFSLDEQLKITDAINDAQYKMNQIPFIYNQNLILPWKMIKMSNTYDFGFPNTINDCILLSENVIKLDKKKLVELLVHEKIHVYQRLYPEIFNDLYQKKYGFVQVNNDSLVSSLYIPNYIINPDGTNLRWVFKLSNGNYLLPICSYNKEYRHLETIYIIFDKYLNIVYQGSGKAINSAYKLDEYLDKYQKISHHYHVNEICAYDLTNYLINGKYLV